jgi:sigma-B regulation protein RsbU (phosphoserine phosphatase)
MLVGMSGQNEPDAEELRRLQAELAARDEEVEQLRVAASSAEREITDLRDLAQDESEQIDQLQEDAVASQRIERAQRALIAELRAEVGEEARAELELGARLRAAELELVDLRAIRDALLPPTLVQREGMSIAAEVLPAEPYVAGDFFFVGDGPGGTVVAAVGDVVGKGLQAARRSAFTRTVLASVAAFSDDPGRLLQWVNVALVERIGESAEFVTAACVTYDPGTRMLRFASAGHPAALRLESGDELTAERTGAALGLTLEIDCRERAERLEAGDGVLLYTDGLLEAGGIDSRYGTSRLRAALRHGKRLAPREILELLKRDLHEFAGERISDDVCLLALRGD